MPGALASGARSIALASALALASGEVAAAPRGYQGPAATPASAVEPDPVASDPTQEPAEDEPVESEPGVDASSSAPVDVVDDYDEVRDSPEGQVATRRIRGGIMLTATGTAMIIGAAILGASDPCERLGGNSCMTTARNRGALVMGIPGALILGAGLTLLGVGFAARRRIAAGVQADRTSGMFVVSGRF